MSTCVKKIELNMSVELVEGQARDMLTKLHLWIWFLKGVGEIFTLEFIVELSDVEALEELSGRGSHTHQMFQLLLEFLSSFQLAEP